MKNFLVLLLISATTMVTLTAQNDEIPYYEIPEAPVSYTAGTVAARMIDGLGFRFYWASKDLTETDLEYKASESARTCGETIDHILSLTNTIYQGVTNLKATAKIEEMSFEEKRAYTLTTLSEISAKLMTSEDLEQQSKTFPFWNNINGPIEDAVWHTGQIVVLRRAAGNPIPSGVNFFSGTVKKK